MDLSNKSKPCQKTGAKTVWRDADGVPLVAPLGGHFRETVAGELVELPAFDGPVPARLKKYLPPEPEPEPAAEPKPVARRRR